MPMESGGPEIWSRAAASALSTPVLTPLHSSDVALFLSVRKTHQLVLRALTGAKPKNT